MVDRRIRSNTKRHAQCLKCLDEPPATIHSAAFGNDDQAELSAAGESGHDVRDRAGVVEGEHCGDGFECLDRVRDQRRAAEVGLSRPPRRALRKQRSAIV